jgi:hypothetical protein
MPKQTITLGTAPTGVGGDTPRSAFSKAQSNFDELYPLVGLGAVTDFGFASSGNYVKFACGVQICWGYNVGAISITNADSQGGGAVIYYGVKQITFPAPFLLYPDVDARFAAAGRLNWTTLAGDPTATAATFYVMSNSSVSVNGTFYWKAVGRWK